MLFIPGEELRSAHRKTKVCRYYPKIVTFLDLAVQTREHLAEENVNFELLRG